MNKLLANLICCFIPKKKNRKHFRNKYLNKIEVVKNKILPEHLLFDEGSNYLYTNNKYLNEKIKNFKKIGITEEKRKNELIVSLTSFPERMKDIKYTIYSLLNQTIKKNKII